MISDLTAPHDGCIEGTADYDWQFHAANQGGVPNTGFTKATAWGVSEWDCNRGPTADVVLETRGFAGYVLADGRWVQVTDSIEWCGVLTPNFSQFADNNSCGSLTGPSWPLPTLRTVDGVLRPVSLHWASRHTVMPSGVVCAFSTYQARITGPGAAAAFVLADAGLDYWNGNDTAVDPSHVGRFVRVTGDWRWVNGSSCTAAQLTANPPPL